MNVRTVRSVTSLHSSFSISMWLLVTNRAYLVTCYFVSFTPMSTIILITLNPYYTDQLHVKFVIRKLNATLPSSVSRRGLGIAARKTRTCFLTSGYSLTDNYFRCGSYVLISSMSGERSSGSQTSLTSFCRYIHFWSEFYFRNSDYTSRPPVFVTSWPWWRPVLHHDGSKRASDQFPGALGRNPTRKTDRYDLRYGWDQSPYLLPAISSNYSLT